MIKINRSKARWKSWLRYKQTKNLLVFDIIPPAAPFLENFRKRSGQFGLSNGFIIPNTIATGQKLARLESMETQKADFQFTNFWRARDFLRLIVDLGMRTYNK